jgi:hypothetical protein
MASSASFIFVQKELPLSSPPLNGGMLGHGGAGFLG